jgi:hypothetical protein
VHQGRFGVCQLRRTPLPERAPDQTLGRNACAKPGRRRCHANRGRPRPPSLARAAPVWLFCARPAPSMPASTTTISAKNSVMSKASRLLVKPCSREDCRRAARDRPREGSANGAGDEPERGVCEARPAAHASPCSAWQDDATGKILAVQFFLSEPPKAISACSSACSPASVAWAIPRSLISVSFKTRRLSIIKT